MGRRRRDIYEYPTNVPGSRRGGKWVNRKQGERGLTYAELVELQKQRSATAEDPLEGYRRMAKPMVEQALRDLGLTASESEIAALIEEVAPEVKSLFESRVRL